MRRLLSTLLIGAGFTASALAATNPHITAHPQARLTAQIDAKHTVTIPNSHASALAKLPDLGAVSGDLQMKHMFLLLSGTPEQEYELKSLLDEQQDKGSQNYHQWLTPETFGAHFGVDSSDLDQIRGWLASQGFTVNNVTKSMRIVDFSGTAAQVSTAFHTEIHNYTVQGVTAHTNATDISIPAALAGMVKGVAGMNNFPLKSDIKPMGKVARGADGQLHPAPLTAGDGRMAAAMLKNGLNPDTNFGSAPTHYIGGSDLKYLWNSKPLLDAGIDGTGVKIGIIGQTEILLSDIQMYRAAFNLKSATPNFILVGDDPGTITDDFESDLDVEASGAMAPGAQLDFYYSGYGTGDGGVDSSVIYVVENNADDIISESYGADETLLGTTEEALVEFFWEQAAAQGISVFVSTGDEGPDEYDGTYGSRYSVSGLSTTPYNVAVGGTMMYEADGPAGTTYWAATNTLPGNSSALGYIPERPWNEGTLDPYGNVGYGGTVGETSGLSVYFQRPAWQSAPGLGAADPVPAKGSVSYFQVAGPHRVVPDVVMEAAGAHDGFLVCVESTCYLDSTGALQNANVVGGTSVAAPTMAGVQALVNQKNGGRQGNPNYYYYPLATLDSTNGTNLTKCAAQSLSLGLSAASGCSFHDIQLGNNFIGTTSRGTIANGGYIGWVAGSGFDAAIGLGSPDVSNLATNWKNAVFSATKTAFTISPTTIPSAGTTQNYTIAVTPASGSGVPTGDVSIIADPVAAGNAIGYVTLSNGSASGSISSTTLAALPAGTYNVHAHYAGDTTYAASDSVNVQVTIGQATPTLTVVPYYFKPTFTLTPATTFTYGQDVYFDAHVCDSVGNQTILGNPSYGSCASGTPTGSVTYTFSKGGVAIAPVATTVLDTFDDAYLDAGWGSAAGGPLIPTYSLLPAGTYSVVAAYQGNTTYKAVTNTPFTIVVGPTASTLTATALTTSVASGGSAQINLSVATVAITGGYRTIAGQFAPSGTISCTDSLNGALPTSTLVPYTTTAGIPTASVVLSTTALTTAGTHTVSCLYNGDANYAASTAAKTVTITVGGTSGTTPVLSFLTGTTAITTSMVGQSLTLRATVGTQTTGTVYFYDGSILLGSATVGATTHYASLAAATTYAAGVHNFTATWGGTTAIQAATSAVTPFTVVKSTNTVQMEADTSNAAATGVGMGATLYPTYQTYNANTGLYGAMVPPPSSPMDFLDNGTVIGSGSLTRLPSSGLYIANFTSKALTPGTHTLTAQLETDPNYVSTASNSQTVSIGLTTTVITSYPTTVGNGNVFSISAKVTGQQPSTAAFTGTVKFYDSGLLIGTATTNTAGLFTANVSVTGLGAHSITAVFSGDPVYYYTSTSAAITVTAITPSFASSISPTSLTIVQGRSGIATISVVTQGAYSGSLVFSCSGLPTNTYCAFPNTGASTYTMTLSSTTLSTTNTVNLAVVTTAPTPPVFGGLLWIPALFFSGFLLVRRKQLSVHGRQFLAVAALLCGTVAMSGCGKNVQYTSSQTGTPLGAATVSINVVATGASSTNPSGTSTIALPINVTAY